MKSYFGATVKSRIDKAINTLLGILHGISADRSINQQEMDLLNNWVDENQGFVDHHPYNELIPKIVLALSDGIFSEGEKEDLVWFCNKWQSNEYYNTITSDLQQLNGILGAISADNVITEDEAEYLFDWMVNHDDLRLCWPYDEVDSLLTTVLKDKRIDPVEHKLLMEFFSSMLPQSINLQSQISTIKTVTGICAIAPEIIFEERCFCFTGDSSRATREQLRTMAMERGARVVNDISPRVNYLVVGTKGNPCWAYACYGRKIEKAMELRKKGAQILIVHEADFLDITQ